MNEQAIDNRQWLDALLEKRGLKVALIEKAAYIASALEPTAAPWFVSYASAYSDGHNNRTLCGRRLDHYASAYADMCEQINLAPCGCHQPLGIDAAGRKLDREPPANMAAIAARARRAIGGGQP